MMRLICNRPSPLVLLFDIIKEHIQHASIYLVLKFSTYT